MFNKSRIIILSGHSSPTVCKAGLKTGNVKSGFQDEVMGDGRDKRRNWDHYSPIHLNLNDLISGYKLDEILDRKHYGTF